MAESRHVSLSKTISWFHYLHMHVHVHVPVTHTTLHTSYSHTSLTHTHTYSHSHTTHTYSHSLSDSSLTHNSHILTLITQLTLTHLYPHTPVCMSIQYWWTRGRHGTHTRTAECFIKHPEYFFGEAPVVNIPEKPVKFTRSPPPKPPGSLPLDSSDTTKDDEETVDFEAHHRPLSVNSEENVNGR